MGTRRPCTRHGRTPARRDSRQHRLSGALRPREDGGWPLPTAGGQRSTPFRQRAPSDQTCLLQPVQKTKKRGLHLESARLRPRRGTADNGMWGRCPHKTSTYFTSTLAPASSSFFFAASASALLMPSLTGLGAPSTRSLASFKPSPVISRTALMTFT